MANPHPFAILNHINADSGIPYVSLSQRDLVLKPYFVSIVLPRKWRFVTQIPVDDRGKTSNVSLAALFDEVPGRSVEPVVVG